MGHLFGLLLIPMLVCGGAFLFFKASITLKEFLLMFSITVAVAIGGFFFARWGSMDDIEHWNGRVTSKDHGAEGCCHSYPCNCVETCSGSGNDRTCATTCDTCYEHGRDYFWSLSYSTGDQNTILNCEPNPNNEPAFWSNTKVGDPASLPHHFTNYLKADPDSLIRAGAPEKYLTDVPPFPQVYAFHKVNKVISHGVPVPAGWQEGLMEMNANLGDQKQVDVVVLFTHHQDPEYAQAVEAVWLYGPKNAVTVVAGVAEGVVTWARVVTLSRVEDLKIAVRDEWVGVRLSDPAEGVAHLERLVLAKFQRTSMSEYEYLASAASPTPGLLLILYLGVLLISVGLSVWMHHKDVFGESGFSFRSSCVDGTRGRTNRPAKRRLW